ncbi:MAG TPA: hypothetical protein VGH66_09875 [Acidimicrobiales bacterium]
MLGAIILAVILVVVLPVLFLLTGTVLAVIQGWLLKEQADDSHEGSELIATNY